MVKTEIPAFNGKQKCGRGEFSQYYMGQVCGEDLIAVIIVGGVMFRAVVGAAWGALVVRVTWGAVVRASRGALVV